MCVWGVERGTGPQVQPKEEGGESVWESEHERERERWAGRKEGREGGRECVKQRPGEWERERRGKWEPRSISFPLHQQNRSAHCLCVSWLLSFFSAILISLVSRFYCLLEKKEHLASEYFFLLADVDVTDIGVWCQAGEAHRSLGQLTEDNDSSDIRISALYVSPTDSLCCLLSLALSRKYLLTEQKEGNQKGDRRMDFSEADTWYKPGMCGSTSSAQRAANKRICMTLVLPWLFRDIKPGREQVHKIFWKEGKKDAHIMTCPLFVMPEKVALLDEQRPFEDTGLISNMTWFPTLPYRKEVLVVIGFVVHRPKPVWQYSLCFSLLG